MGRKSTIGLPLACFFDVPDDYTVPGDLKVLVEFIAVSSRRFRYVFTRTAPGHLTVETSSSLAA